jgi:hypothetical protein
VLLKHLCQEWHAGGWCWGTHLARHGGAALADDPEVGERGCYDQAVNVRVPRDADHVAVAGRRDRGRGQPVDAALWAHAQRRSIGVGGRERRREEQPARWRHPSACQPRGPGRRGRGRGRAGLGLTHFRIAVRFSKKCQASQCTQREKIRPWHAQLLAVVYECVTILDNINISVK